ncbi:hypothetical protein G6M89_12055 [Natronolimnobius sp. AArcel1]|uniref:hypothetical protein n=1 Tax=Natronolimnobius sp. AArcel1 TaxID=1679093 RepID=UPI0013EC2B34|nr:hypothetical protein [Natronolimnobius sp. AArcel1]NGM69732.1 hypothetical protein [Natronolimnobius sp. AArcel1]
MRDKIQWPGAGFEHREKSAQRGRAGDNPVTDRERPTGASGPTTDVNEDDRTSERREECFSSKLSGIEDPARSSGGSAARLQAIPKESPSPKERDALF